jgi:hypothetical protein
LSVVAALGTTLGQTDDLIKIKGGGEPMRHSQRSELENCL